MQYVLIFSQTVNLFTELDPYPLPRVDDQIDDIAKSKITAL